MRHGCQQDTQKQREAGRCQHDARWAKHHGYHTPWASMGAMYITRIRYKYRYTYRFYRLLALYYLSMAKVAAIPSPLDMAVDKIRKLAADSANVYFVGHASSRMEERGIVQTQVIECLQRGTVVEGPVWDSYQQSGWKVTMDLFCAGKSLGVAAKLVEKGDSHIIVITAFVK